jgi:hypothetical protein
LIKAMPTEFHLVYSKWFATEGILF